MDSPPAIPETDVELTERLRVLYAAAAPYSEGARDDFWNAVADNIDRLISLAGRAATGKRPRSDGYRNGGLARAASMTPDQRREQAREAALARWRPQKG